METRIRWTTMFGTSGVLIGRSRRIFGGSKFAYGFSLTQSEVFLRIVESRLEYFLRKKKFIRANYTISR